MEISDKLITIWWILLEPCKYEGEGKNIRSFYVVTGTGMRSISDSFIISQLSLWQIIIDNHLLKYSFPTLPTLSTAWFGQKSNTPQTPHNQPTNSSLIITTHISLYTYYSIYTYSLTTGGLAAWETWRASSSQLTEIKEGVFLESI